MALCTSIPEPGTQGGQMGAVGPVGVGAAARWWPGGRRRFPEALGLGKQLSACSRRQRLASCPARCLDSPGQLCRVP